MNKNVRLIFIIGAIVIANTFCMILGPIVWIRGAAHFAKYEDFKENGKTADGFVYGRSTKENFKVNSYTLSIGFLRDHHILTSGEVSVSKPLWSAMKDGDDVNILYKEEGEYVYEVILEESYQDEYLVLADTPAHGKWMTLISYSIFLVGIGILLWLRRKSRPKAYRRMDESPYRNL